MVRCGTPMLISLADVKEIVARAGGIAIERIPDDPHARLDRLGLDSIAYVSSRRDLASGFAQRGHGDAAAGRSITCTPSTGGVSIK